MTERPECRVAWSISTHGEFTGVSCSGMTSEPLWKGIGEGPSVDGVN